MRKSFLRALIFALGLSGLGITVVQSQANPQQPPAGPKEEVVMAEDLTRILKEEWQYLKDETDAYLKTVESKAEFETKKEFEDRVARLKQAYVSKINSHIAEKKFDKRVFALLLKANLVSYSPDSGRYVITSGYAEAPYNTPTIRCSVPNNNYFALADSSTRGYRSSTLYLKFRPNFKWNIGRDAARQAKSDEANVYFKLNMVLDLTQAEIKNQANIKIVPKEISLVNRQNMQKLWDGGQVRILPVVTKQVKKRPAKEPALISVDSTVVKPAQKRADSTAVQNPK